MFFCACCHAEKELADLCEVPCDCLLCKTCLVAHVGPAVAASAARIVSSKQPGQLVAPCPSCNHPFYARHLQAASPSQFPIWESQISHANLAGSEGISQCPYPDCRAWIEAISPVRPRAKRRHPPSPDGSPEVVIIDADGDNDGEADEDPEAAAKQHFEQHRYRCGLCKRDFCVTCSSRPYHKGFTCRHWRAPKCQHCGTRVLHKGDLRNPHPHPRLMRRMVAEAGLETFWCIERSDFQFLYDQLRASCTADACREKLRGTCLKRLACGHACHGICNESPCLRCIDPNCQGSQGGASTSSAPARPPPAEDCFFCWEAMPSAPCIELSCGHICHLHCARERLKAGYPGPGISFQFLYCPLCGTGDSSSTGGRQQATSEVHLSHPALEADLKPHLELRARVAEVAKVRLKVEVEVAKEEQLQPGGQFDGRPVDYALSKFVFFKCHRCTRPYFGGQRACGDNNEGQQFNPEELICGECSAQRHGSDCPRHGNTYIEWKCRYCCNISCWFCFGTTHFCDPCHRNSRNARPLPCNPATCPLKGAHPPPGTEHCLGCGLCRRADVV